MIEDFLDCVLQGLNGFQHFGFWGAVQRLS